MRNPTDPHELTRHRHQKEMLPALSDLRAKKPKANFRRRADHKRTAGRVAGGNTMYYAPQQNEIVYANLIEYYLPKNLASQHRLWRQVYLFDSICGSSIDLYADMPWSDFQITGISDPKQVALLERGIEPLELPTYLPWITREYLALGKVCTHFLFDINKGGWSGQIIHNPDNLEVEYVPILQADPLVNLKPDQNLLSFAHSRDVRHRELIRQIHPEVLQSIRNGEMIKLHPSNTLYLPRKSSPNDYLGTSIYMRALAVIIFERALMNASIVSAQRRSSPLRLLSWGGKDPTTYHATDEDIEDLADQLLQAEEDLAGGVIASKRPIDVNTIGSNQEMWKISDEYQFITDMKLKAFGLSDSFLSGDMNFSTTDTQLSVFLERVKTLRKYITQKYIIEKAINPLVDALEIYPRKKSDMGTAKAPSLRTSNRTDNRYDIGIKFKTQLTPQADTEWLDILERAADKGVPVTLSTWASAAGVDLTAEIEALDEDVVLRQDIKKQLEPLVGDEDGGDDRWAKASAFPGYSPMSNSGDMPNLTGLPRNARVKHLGFDQHPFYSSASGRYLDIPKEKFLACLQIYVQNRTANTKHRWKRFCSIAQERFQFAPIQLEALKYAFYICGLAVPKLTERGAKYLFGQLRRRIKPERKTFWAVVNTIASLTQAQGKESQKQQLRTGLASTIKSLRKRKITMPESAGKNLLTGLGLK